MKKQALRTINLNNPIMKGTDMLFRLSFLEGFLGAPTGALVKRAGRNPINLLKKVFEENNITPHPSWLDSKPDLLLGMVLAVPTDLRGYLEDKIQDYAANLSNPSGTEAKPYYVGKTFPDSKRENFLQGEIPTKSIGGTLGQFVKNKLFSEMKREQRIVSPTIETEDKELERENILGITDPRSSEGLRNLIDLFSGNKEFWSLVQEEINKFPFEEVSEIFGVSKKLVTALGIYTTRVNRDFTNLQKDILSDPRVTLEDSVKKEIRALPEGEAENIASLAGSPEKRRQVFTKFIEVISKAPEAMEGRGVIKKITGDLGLDSTLVERILGKRNALVIQFLRAVLQKNPKIRKAIEEAETQTLSFKVAKSYMKKISAFRDDPFWMTAKRDGKDIKGNPIRRGDKILYWPRTKSVMIGKEAEQAWREFQSQKADEEFLTR